MTRPNSVAVCASQMRNGNASAATASSASVSLQWRPFMRAVSVIQSEAKDRRQKVLRSAPNDKVWLYAFRSMQPLKFGLPFTSSLVIGRLTSVP
jgi:hypothetical protein